ncbi:hypothetical protein [Flavobacterium cyanobacteriorum]|uniref:hypothetical protein n=1 Tax=Flavobacterium cyanobacteriorum TaxID=2022802 RepID=UPI0013FD84C3|nr:hypothetical protein [Flavobacterium cyanobacteriorum]
MKSSVIAGLFFFYIMLPGESFSVFTGTEAGKNKLTVPFSRDGSGILPAACFRGREI